MESIHINSKKKNDSMNNYHRKTTNQIGGNNEKKQYSSSLSRYTNISKTLAWLLRHGAAQQNLPIEKNGFIELNLLLEHSSLKSQCCTVSDIEHIVAQDQKNRYALMCDSKTGAMKIRANQGHSIESVNDMNLIELTNENLLPKLIVHGTFHKYWSQIKSSGGLKRMKRNHIHFTDQDNGTAKSGFRSNCEILIYINGNKAIESGITFFRSDNGVILSPGDRNGVIKIEYFDKVIDRKTKENLLINKNITPF